MSAFIAGNDSNHRLFHLSLYACH